MNMSEQIDREVIGGHLLVIGGAEDKYNERRILKKFLELAGGEKSGDTEAPGCGRGMIGRFFLRRFT